MNDDILNEIDTDDGLAKACVVSCLETNHANTFALLEVMRACPVPRPYRDVENKVKDLPVMHMTHQNAHVLADILVHCGALEKIEVPEAARKDAKGESATADESGEATVAAEDAESAPVYAVEGADAGAADAADAKSERAADVESNEKVNSGAGKTEERHISFASPVDDPSAFDPDFDWDDEEDMPVDYLLVITPAGQAALEDYEPTKRLNQMIGAEDACYHDVYRRVLQFCAEGDGATSDDIENSILGHPALRSPKVLYAGYFISRLEDAGGITWQDGGWRTTETGRSILKTLPVEKHDL